MGYICHFLASAYIYIGELYLPDKSGWIYKLQILGLVESDYSSLYIASMYYVLTTLSTVGYGDITGENEGEHLF